MKFFTKEVKIALTAILSVIIIYVGGIFLKGIDFGKSNNILYVIMDDVDGLAVASKVTANGVVIGTVADVTFNSEQQKVKVKVELDDNVKITKGSTATLTKEMLGAPQLKIILAPNKNGFLNVNETIYGALSTDLLSAAGDIMPKVEGVMGKVDTLLNNVNFILQNPAINNSLYNVEEITGNIDNSTKGIPYIINDFRDVSGNFKTVSQNLVNTAGGTNAIMEEARQAIANLNKSTQSINNICRQIENDMPKVLNNLDNIGDNLSNTTNQLAHTEFKQLVDNINDAVIQLNGLTASINSSLSSQDSSLGKLLNNPDVYNQLDSTLQSATLLLQDLKNNPKRYVHFSIFGKK